MNASVIHVNLSGCKIIWLSVCQQINILSCHFQIRMNLLIFILQFDSRMDLLFISSWTECLIRNFVHYMEFPRLTNKQIQNILVLRVGKIPYPGTVLVTSADLSTFCFYQLKHEQESVTHQNLVHLSPRGAARLHRRPGRPQTETAQTPFLHRRRRQGLPTHAL